MSINVGVNNIDSQKVQNKKGWNLHHLLLEEKKMMDKPSPESTRGVGSMSPAEAMFCLSLPHLDRLLAAVREKTRSVSYFENIGRERHPCEARS